MSEEDKRKDPIFPSGTPIDWSTGSRGDNMGLPEGGESVPSDRAAALKRPAIERKSLDPSGILGKVDKGYGGTNL